MTFVAFLPALGNGFVWDDAANLVNNARYRGLGRAELHWMWTTALLGPYVPVSWMTLGLDYVVWGNRPFGYHLTNLLLHSANALLFYLVARRLLGAARPSDDEDRSFSLSLAAAFSALFFSLHPLRVESVAWVTERRDVVCGFFFLLSILAYLRYCETESPPAGKGWPYFVASLGCFLFALLSKPVAVSLPAVLVILDTYPLGRLARPLRWWHWWEPGVQKLWVEKIPFVLASGVVSTIALLAMRRTPALTPVSALGAVDRLAVSVYGLTFYLWKTAAPVRLSALYELLTPIDPLAWPFLVSAAIAAAISWLAIRLRRQWPALGAAWLAYVAMLLPVLGIVHNGLQIAADRYTYLASLPVAIVAGGGVRRCWEAMRARPARRDMALGLAASALGVLAVLTWLQVQVWHDNESLWRHALGTVPSSVAHNGLGNVLAARGEGVGAIDQYREALRIRPDYAEPENNWGLVLGQHGRFAAAIDHFRTALRIKPQYADAEHNWGMALFYQGQWESAAEHFGRALRIDPHHVLARVYLDLVRARLSRTRQPQ